MDHWVGLILLVDLPRNIHGQFTRRTSGVTIQGTMLSSILATYILSLASEINNPMYILYCHFWLKKFEINPFLAKIYLIHL